MHNDTKWVTIHSLIAWAFRQEAHTIQLTKFQPLESGRFGGCDAQRAKIAASVMLAINLLPPDQRGIVWCAFAGRITDVMSVAGELPQQVYIRSNGGLTHCPVPLQLRNAIVREWLGGDCVNTRQSAVLIKPHSHMAVQRLKIKLMRELDRALLRAVCAVQTDLIDLVSNPGMCGELF
ncbi:hypothetical protein [Deefgea sp. CFH1-16]|uniref:hypothetical protein n=1 Tax=Deefgea sp. CFH1-16 TaxID=2675457 RepID=UPI0015F52464|nr:hypothetical protein [Deefgea sp. CFH1-16]MBM5575821.1 hypothetical protein [Deefgea sp. CFH1-16]